jgi:biopolymer transport protein ExbB/TolQ
MLQNTGTISRVVLSVLLVLSIWSWGVILGKALLLRKVHSESNTFWRIFRKGKNLSEIGAACETLRFTPLVAVFNSGAPYATKKSSNTNALQRVMQAVCNGTTNAPRKSADFPGNDRFSGAVHRASRNRRCHPDVVPAPVGCRKCFT